MNSPHFSGEAPWFEDFSPGDEFNQVPAVTIHAGYAALYQSIFGDRSRLYLDLPLCQAVTQQPRLLVNPLLVTNIAIGQSTLPSQRVLGNLFYRGLHLQRPVFIGDTLKTSTKVLALRQNTQKPGRPASGLVALEIEVLNQADDLVLRFWRCPMIPCRDPEADTGQTDDFSCMPEQLSDTDIIARLPEWQLEPLRLAGEGPAYTSGMQFHPEARDTVTSAPELVRLTLNLAMAHTDASRSLYRRRLVYGGHTLGIAAAQLSRVLPELATILAWYRCEHLAPVFEEDILGSVISIQEVQQTPRGRLAKIHLEVFAEGAADTSTPPQEAPTKKKVLDWHLAALLV